MEPVLKKTWEHKVVMLAYGDAPGSNAACVIGGAYLLLISLSRRLRYRRNPRRAKAASPAMPTPTPTPAFAPVESPPEPWTG